MCYTGLRGLWHSLNSSFFESIIETILQDDAVGQLLAVHYTKGDEKTFMSEKIVSNCNMCPV